MSYYEILEVSQNASKEVIKAAYKSLMQRYHPDRNPGNAEIAERASLVVQAYEVLSDLDKRAAYDLQFKDQSQDLSDNIQDRSRGVRGPASRRGTKERKSYWYVWLLIIMIVFSSWIILSLTKKRQPAESELKEIRQLLDGKQLSQEQLQEKIRRMDEILQAHPEILKKEANARAIEEEARVIPLFVSQLTIHLKIPERPVEEKIKPSDEPGKAQDERDKGSGESVKLPAEPGKSPAEAGTLPADSGHILSIPVLGVKVGSIDPDKVIRHLQSKADLISQRLAEKLADAKYDELIKIDGEEYLKKIILDSIGDTTGTDRFASYPPSATESPGRYGVVDVFFPEDYVVR